MTSDHGPLIPTPPRRAVKALLVAACLALYLVRGWMAAEADGTTVDEPYHLFYGARALAHGTFIRPSDDFNSKMPVSVLNAVPVAVAEHFAGRLPWHRRLVFGRLPSLLLGALLGGLVFAWARALFGWASGVLALFLYTFCPNILAHSHLVTTDISTALGMFAAAYCFWRYLEGPTRGRLLVAAAAFGGAQLTKATALFLLPIFAFVLLLRALRATEAGGAPLGRDPGGGQGGGRRHLRAEEVPAAAAGRSEEISSPAPGRLALLGRRLPHLAGRLALLAAGGLLVLNLGFLCEGTFSPLKSYGFVSETFRSLAGRPLIRDLPLPLPYAYLQGIDMVARDAQATAWSYLHGRFSDHGFWSYFLIAFAVKVPLSTQLLLVLSLWLCLTGKVVAPGGEDFLAVPIVVLLAYFSLVFHLQIGLRYILPIFPFVFVFISRLAAWRPARSRAGIAAAAAVLGWNAVASFWCHPYYLPYFNELIGGPANGYRWLIDSNLDWGQDAQYVREVYVPRSAVPVLIEPPGPAAGRIVTGISALVGHDPHASRLHAWLRDNFHPLGSIHRSWLIYDVREDELEKCCGHLARTWLLPDQEPDLAAAGQPTGGADLVRVRLLARLNDGSLGANDEADPARTVPPMGKPVGAWFGIDWPTPQVISRVVAYPGFYSRGGRARKFLALDYVFQSWDGGRWLDIPGTRVSGNNQLRVEHRFPPIRTTRIRLVIERERNDRGGLDETGGFRAACLELAAFSR